MILIEPIAYHVGARNNENYYVSGLNIVNDYLNTIYLYDIVNNRVELITLQVR